MNARWRTVLRVRAVLRLLLDAHVPLGALSRVVEQARGIADEDLPNEQRVFGATMTGALARDILNELLGDDVELIDRDVPVAGEPHPTRDTREQLQAARDLVQLWDVDRFERYLDGEGFYNLMQTYRHASVVPQGEVSAAFEAIKTVLKERVRR